MWNKNQNANLFLKRLPKKTYFWKARIILFEIKLKKKKMWEPQKIEIENLSKIKPAYNNFFF